eukprot:1282494-Rhodomonas_salina.1
MSRPSTARTRSCTRTSPLSSAAPPASTSATNNPPRLSATNLSPTPTPPHRSASELSGVFVELRLSVFAQLRGFVSVLDIVWSRSEEEKVQTREIQRETERETLGQRASHGGWRKVSEW